MDVENSSLDQHKISLTLQKISLTLQKARLLKELFEIKSQSGDLDGALEDALEGRNLLESEGLVKVYRDADGGYFSGPNGWSIEFSDRAALELHVSLDAAVMHLTAK